LILQKVNNGSNTVIILLIYNQYLGHYVRNKQKFCQSGLFAQKHNHTKIYITKEKRMHSKQKTAVEKKYKDTKFKKKIFH
jgi:hypothetical protein